VNQAADWLLAAVERGASDLHLVAGHPPTMRLHGELTALPGQELSQQDVWKALEPLLPVALRERFATEKNADFALVLEAPHGPQRFRANFFYSGQSIGACFRVIPDKIPSFDWAGFPEPLAERLIHFRNGLVLLCGVTGSGKTTTLAMLVDRLIREGGYRVLTIEEPIEYVFARTPDSVVTQREVGRDVQSFADGLKYGLRQDPDVILVGEIRDRDTGQIALSAAETGHLVLATMHTRDAKGAISRYADLFPQSVQTEIRAQLATALRAVISQHLLPSIVPGEKRELALEVMFNSSAVSAAIRQGKLESIDNCLVTSRSDGMLPLSESIRRLYAAVRISEEVAAEFVDDPSTLRR
jgi:twitching motility protein PilT